MVPNELLPLLERTKEALKPCWAICDNAVTSDDHQLVVVRNTVSLKFEHVDRLTLLLQLYPFPGPVGPYDRLHLPGLQCLGQVETQIDKFILPLGNTVVRQDTSQERLIRRTTVLPRGNINLSIWVIPLCARTLPKNASSDAAPLVPNTAF